MKLKIIISKIHLYSGLQASIALLIFSTVGIISYSESHQEPVISHHKFMGDFNKKDIKLARTVHNQFGLRFEPVPQKGRISKIENDILLINTYSPKARREIRLNKTNGDIEITLWPFSFSEFLIDMHTQSLGMRLSTDSLWLWAWSLYIELSLISLFILPVTGLYIWISGRSIKKQWAQLSLGSSVIITIILWNLIR